MTASGLTYPLLTVREMIKSSKQRAQIFERTMTACGKLLTLLIEKSATRCLIKAVVPFVKTQPFLI